VSEDLEGISGRGAAAQGDRVFQQEYLCQFVQAEDTFFNDEDVQACVRPEIPVLWR
jgi:hypothetical protein